MLATDPHPQSPSLLRRSSAIWRRISRRSRHSPSPSHPHSRSDNPAPNKLQKRNLITHLQRLDAHPPAPPVRPVNPTPSPRVLASDMRTTSFPPKTPVHTVPWNVYLSPEQVHAFFLGFRPEMMEDRWLICSEGPDPMGKLKVHFFRSWTGVKIAELFIVIDLRGEGAGKIVGIKWNAGEETNRMEEVEAKFMIGVTSRWVLGVSLEGR